MGAGHRTASFAFGEFLLKKQKDKIMAVVIRLARHGAKKRPYYHIVVMDNRLACKSGNVLEVIGKYNPMVAKDSADRVKLDVDKAKSWMAKGARPSDRVYRFLANAGVLPVKPHPVQTKKNQPSEKTKMKIKDKEEKLAKIAEAKAAEEAAAKAESEKPAEAPAEEVATTEKPVETPAEKNDVPETETNTETKEVKTEEITTPDEKTTEPATETVAEEVKSEAESEVVKEETSAEEPKAE